MKLCIGNLPYDISESEVLKLFKEFGEIVNAHLVKDQYTGRSRGFAFIEMDSRSSGQQAMESLNKKVYKNKSIVCNEVTPQKKGKRRR
jgi:RNA recognition motif-containing protein